MEDFYEKLNIPKSCLLDKTIFKKIFLDNADLLSSDKKILTNVVKKIIWKYTLKPETINIMPYKSEDRDYLEIEIIEVQITDILKSKRIAEIIMRSIPYPILLVFIKDNKIQLATGDMRRNLNDSLKVTVDSLVFTDWFEIGKLDEFVNSLIESINFEYLNCNNYYQLYKDITKKLNIYNLSKTKGEIIVLSEIKMSDDDIKRCCDDIQIIDNQIIKLKSQIKKSDSIKEKVEINIQIDKLKKEKEVLISKI